METTPWKGRDEGPGAINTRWHHMVYAGQERTAQDAEGVALVGFRSHEGTVRSQGRPGAAEGPYAIRHALAQLAFHGGTVVHDRGDVTVDGHGLEEGQQEMGELVAEALAEHRLAFVLGGGHETTYAAYRGLVSSGKLEGVGSWGIISLDAHFGLRERPEATSTTVFHQIIREEKKAGRDFHYSVLGISEADNTRSMFQNAEKHAVPFLKDVHASETQRERVREFLAERLTEVELVFLSIDLDVLPAYQAPGVSSPATLGVPYLVVEEACRQVAASGKLALTDVVGLIPALDQDDRTARAAARLVNWTSLTAFDRPAADDATAQQQVVSEREASMSRL